MAADEARRQIVARVKLQFECLKNGDIDGAVGVYTKDGTFMYNDTSPVRGRKAWKEVWMSMPFNALVFEEATHFDLFSDTAAYLNYQCAGVDSSGKKLELFHTGTLWKKIDGTWYKDRTMVNSRPWPETPETIAKTNILKRYADVFDALNKEDYDAALQTYADEPSFIPLMGEPASNKEGVDKILRQLMPELKPTTFEEMYYFELLNDNTAYTNSYGHSVNKDGKVKERFRDALIWTKVNGEWYIKSLIYHHDHVRPNLE